MDGLPNVTEIHGILVKKFIARGFIVVFAAEQCVYERVHRVGSIV